jgi:hypothetical protein
VLRLGVAEMRTPAKRQCPTLVECCSPGRLPCGRVKPGVWRTFLTLRYFML